MGDYSISDVIKKSEESDRLISKLREAIEKSDVEGIVRNSALLMFHVPEMDKGLVYGIRFFNTIRENYPGATKKELKQYWDKFKQSHALKLSEFTEQIILDSVASAMKNKSYQNGK